MKKLSLILSMMLIFSSSTASADTAADKILTLEEAKALALKNDVQYNLQQSYIQDAKEQYAELSEDSSTTIRGGSDIADRTAASISKKVQLESAASNVRKAVLTKENLSIASDYEVTTLYYAVIEAQNSLASAEEDLEIKKKALEAAKVKYNLAIVNRNSFTQEEAAYSSAEAAYNKAGLELENSVSKLAKSIGEELSASTIKLDKTLSIPDIATIYIERIKNANLKNNLTYFSAMEQYKLTEYEMDLTVEKYDYYFENLDYMNSSVEEKFDNMLYDAKKEFQNVESSYNEKLDDLEYSIKEQYDNLIELLNSYEDSKKEIEDKRLSVQQDRIKYQMGLITKAALDSSDTNLKKLENQLNSTIISLNTQYMNLTQYSLDE